MRLFTIKTITMLIYTIDAKYADLNLDYRVVIVSLLLGALLAFLLSKWLEK